MKLGSLAPHRGSPNRGVLRRRLAVSALLVLLGAALLWVAWPAAQNVGSRRTLEMLARLDGPVLVPLAHPTWALSAQVAPDSYRISVGRPGTAAFIDAGERAGSDSGTNGAFMARGVPISARSFRDESTRDRLRELSWNENGMRYTVTLPESIDNFEAATLIEGLISPPMALAGGQAWRGDTPLLFAFYLPLFGLFLIWSISSLVRERPGRLDPAMTSAGG